MGRDSVSRPRTRSNAIFFYAFIGFFDEAFEGQHRVQHLPRRRRGRVVAPAQVDGQRRQRGVDLQQPHGTLRSQPR